MQADRVLTEQQRLLSTLERPEQVQSELLAGILATNQDTDYSRVHALSKVGDADEYRRAVPIRTHEDLMPWIDRMLAGESRVLTAEDPVMYFSSSGSTGREKHIPVTPSYMREVFLPFYYASFGVLVRSMPQLLSSADEVLNLWQDPGSPKGSTRGGQQHIGPSQVDYQQFGESSAAAPGGNASWSRIPPELADADPYERAYFKLRLAAEQNIRLLIAVNPALAAGLPYQLAQVWPRLVEEIRAGTLGGRPHGTPDPVRADEIARHAAEHGTLRPRDLWPELSAIVVWNSALGSLYLPNLSESYGPGVELIDAPIASSEGPAAVPVDRSPLGAPLYLPGCFYEFVPADRRLTEDAETVLAHELEVGRDYHLVVSHLGGLYRCAITDVVEVTGHLGRTPRIRYAGRGVERPLAGIRLTEPSVIRALAAAVADTGARLRNATVKPAGDRYQVAVAGDLPEGFAAALDARLGETADGYRAARTAGTLAPVQVVRVHHDAFLHEWERSIRAGQRPSRVKDRIFLPGTETWARIVTDQEVAA
ncbi:hypothetical protein GCM10010172_39610 [Paractinoplanes ferrugineus]|uniref:GH3 middle domain-containing protein n=1 Tax=Paractinoplanes ferrugineus TaxID=113564 RepID=A0A919MEG1_9ACTN|nr:GH3 auxin-responsive promoter family protein [Actinoplanes ferrugineus]GIE12738.1 hypothetical protein Afe05nite_45780 [Actinoplanes ferrugineus]